MDTPYGNQPDDRAAAYDAEFRQWKERNDIFLKDSRIDEDAYQGKVWSRPDALGKRHLLVSLRSLTGIVESNVAKLMAATQTLNVPVHGPIPEVNRGIEGSLRSVYESLRDDPQAPTSYWGEREKAVRDYEVSGNAVLEINWDPATESVFWEYLDYSSIGYHPAYTLETSPVYYVLKYVSLQWLESQEEALGFISGSMDRIREVAEKDGKRVWRVSTENLGPTYVGQNGDENYQDIDDLELLIRWESVGESWKCCWTVSGVMVLESDDFLGIGEHNLAILMARKFKDRPLGTGTVSMGRGVSFLKDESANQRAQAIARGLVISGIVTDNNADMAVAQMVASTGGLMRANAGTAYVPIAGPPVQPSSFQDSETFQQEIERVTNFSAYSAGLPNQVSDQTAGTASGIKAITQGAVPVDKLKLKSIEERLDTKFARVAMKLCAVNTGEPRWALRAGGSQDYVQISKRLMSGHPQWTDLEAAGVVSQEEAAQYTTVTQDLPVTDPMTGGMVMDPQTGQPLTQTQSVQPPEMKAAPYVNQDWLFTVTLDPQTENEKEQKARERLAFFQEAAQLGLPVNMQKAVEDAAGKLGIERFSDFLYSPQEIAQQKADAQAAQQAQLDAQAAQADQAHTHEMEKKTADQHHEVALNAATTDVAALANPQAAPAY